MNAGIYYTTTQQQAVDFMESFTKSSNFQFVRLHEAQLSKRSEPYLLFYFFRFDTKIDAAVERTVQMYMEQSGNCVCVVMSKDDVSISGTMENLKTGLGYNEGNVKIPKYIDVRLNSDATILDPTKLSQDINDTITTFGKLEKF